MPHFVVEYTDNLTDPRIADLLTAVNQVLVAQDGIFPTGGIRSRAVRVTEYAIADQAADYAFVHAKLLIGAGRSLEEKKRVGDDVFEAIKRHFETAFAARPLAISLDLEEVGELGSWKHNNLHSRFKKL